MTVVPESDFLINVYIASKTDKKHTHTHTEHVQEVMKDGTIRAHNLLLKAIY